MRRLQTWGEARYRNIEESRIVELLLHDGWAFDVAAGARAEAEHQARAALDRCVAIGLAHRRSASGERLFDPVEVSNFLESAGRGGLDRTWEDRCLPNVRRLVWQAHGGGDPRHPPPPPAALGPARYAVSIRRTFNLERFQPGEMVRLRLPLPLEDAFLGEVLIDFIPPEGAAAQAAVGPARLDALVQVPEGGRATIGVKASFTAWPVVPVAPAAPLDPAEAELYTRPKEGLIRVSARVEALAAELAGAEEDRWAVVRRFWAFMMEQLACGSIHHDQLDPAAPADWVLERGWYDCQVGSALFAALCRARRIPARLVSGYMLQPAAPGFHTWLEVWFDEEGWVPFDLLGWSLSMGGRDTGWRDYYFGALDHRMAVERPPRLFGGPGAVRLPRAWHMLASLGERGSEAVFESVDTGALVYREFIEVERLE
jgi:hypothetical protein